MTFADTSSKIIRESISSAIYIDDKVRLPFEQVDVDGSLIDQSALFASFKENNCYLDFNRYTKDAGIDYGPKLLNKDLLILDWHLDEDETDVTATFALLEQALGTQSLHFCVIYTNQNQESLAQKVVLNIGSYFSGLTKELADAALNAYKELLDGPGIPQNDQDAISTALGRLCSELFFDQKNAERKPIILASIREETNKITTVPLFAQFLNGLELPAKNFTEQLICLGFILNQNDVPDVANRRQVNLPSDKYTIRIGSLFINVFSKEQISDAELYSAFTTALMKGSNIFLTLLGLEIRNRFRETSGFIGKELDDLNQLAFFYHRKNHFADYKELFDEFLKDIWKDQVASFLLEKDIELFGVIDEYEADNNVANDLNGFVKTNEKDRNDLARLNFVYNRLAIQRKENDAIRFGDIFQMDLGMAGRVLLLCLTPHCDCLRPEKIKNMYFFVEGTDISVARGVEKNDGSFISYVEVDGTLTCIDWTNGTDDCKPFSFYIKTPLIQGPSQNVSISYKGKNRPAAYVGSLKENYAQRIANKAFFYPLRVGIDFASFGPDD